MTTPDIIIMAAGKGTRMQSSIPKVLQRLAGRPLLHHVLDQAAKLQARQVVVVTGHEAAQVEAACANWTCADNPCTVQYVRQEPQLGTGHAVQQAMPRLAHEGTGGGTVLVLSGDVPLTQADTLAALVQASSGTRLALLTVTLPDPTGYGRVLRGDNGAVQRIIEDKDASASERSIGEVYSGIMAAPAQHLAAWLTRLRNQNVQGEYYLTDIVALAVQGGVPVVAHRIDDPVQVAGVNSPQQLAALERACQWGRAQAVMAQGVRLADPARFEMRDAARSGVRAALDCGPDVEIDVGCIFTGRVTLGEGVRIGAYCCIANAHIAAGATLAPYTHIDGEHTAIHVGEEARIGPFARLRPGTHVGRAVHIGNFVEVKNSRLADGAKANHLAYLGDADVGARVNYGAGSITANYDGAHKHRTVIEADVHVGSNCVLVAPVTIGRGATVGAGSTVTKDAAADALTVARGKQVHIAHWKRPGSSHDGG